MGKITELFLNKEGVYKAFLLLLMVSIAGGSYLYGFNTPIGTLYSFRIVLVLLALFMIVKKDFCLPRKGAPLLFSVFLTIMILYGGVLSYWSLDQMASFKALFNLSVGLLLWITLWNLHKRFEWFWEVIIKSWIFTLMLILFLCYWEILTGNHLQGNFLFKLIDFPSYHIIQVVPVATFDNPNYLALYLTLSIALVLYFKKYMPATIYITLIVLSLIVILTTDSKLSSIALFIIAPIFLFYSRNEIKELLAKRVKKILLGGLISSVFLFGVFNSEHYTNGKNISTIESNPFQGAFLNIEKVKSGSSYRIRKNLILNGFDFLVQSKFLGLGPAQYSVYTYKGFGKHETETILSPHSLFIELLSEYGVIITLFFVGLCLFFLRKLLLFFNLEGSLKRNFLYLFMTLLFVYPVLSNNNSSFLTYPLNWFILSFIILLHQELDMLKNEKHTHTNNS